jgi:ribose transport system substrate-binding protein
MAVQNAEAFVRERVDVVIEFQVEQHVAPIIADKIAAARIPLIAVDIPHPHSTYFGVDNYRVGYEAGTLLADFAVNHWKGRADWVLGLDLEAAGTTVQSRITGAFEAIRTRLPNLPIESFVRMDGRGIEEKTCTVVREFLKRHPRDSRILIAAANDSSALGAIAALRELGREGHAAVVGQDFVEEMESEMRRAGTPAIGTVSHEVHQYGPRLVELGLALLRGDKVSPYNYVEHRTISVDQVLRTPHTERRAAYPDPPAPATKPEAPAKRRRTAVKR